MANVSKSLAKGTAWIAGARLMTNALGFVGILVLARLLTPDDFGLVALATTMLAILASVTDLSLTSALVQHKSPSADHFHAAWTLQAMRSALLALLFALGSLPAASAFDEPRLVGVMLVLSLSVFLGGLANPRAIMMTRALVFWQQFMLQVADKLTALLVSMAIAFAYRSYWALVWGVVAGQMVSLCLSYTVLPFRPRPRLRGGRELLGFSLWLTLGQMINTINWRADHLFIGAYLGRSVLGYYTVGDRLAVMPTREVTGPITQTLFPAFSRLAERGDQLRDAYQRAQALVTAIALPAGVGTALIAHPLILLTMGEKWLPVVIVIQALASVFAFQTLGSLSQPLAMATGNTRLLFRRDLQGFLIRLPTIVAGMLIAGFPGIISARVLTGSIGILLHMQVVKKITGLSLAEQLAANTRSIASVVAMAGVVAALGHVQADWGDTTDMLLLRIGTLIAAGGAVYVGTHALLWAAAKQPQGPETELLRMIGGLRRKRMSAACGASACLPPDARAVAHRSARREGPRRPTPFSKREDSMRFSVVICTRNRASALCEVLASIDRARRPEVAWELVVVDNGSTDDTAAVVESFRPRLPIRRVREETAGLSNARNRGVAEARGAYILWTDDDVLVRPDWLCAFAAAFDAHPDAVIFGGRVLPLYAEPKVDWFVAAEAELRSLLAYRDFDGPITPERMPYGACYALRSDMQRRFPYDPDLGVAPGRRTPGEETAVLEAIYAAGGRGIWVHDAVVDHVISRERQSRDYILAYYRAQGQLHPRQGRWRRDPLIAGAPLSLWLRTARCYLRYHRRRAAGGRWVGVFAEYARLLGSLDRCRGKAPHAAAFASYRARIATAAREEVQTSSRPSCSTASAGERAMRTPG